MIRTLATCLPGSVLTSPLEMLRLERITINAVKELQKLLLRDQVKILRFLLHPVPRHRCKKWKGRRSVDFWRIRITDDLRITFLRWHGVLLVVFVGNHHDSDHFLLNFDGNVGLPTVSLKEIPMKDLPLKRIPDLKVQPRNGQASAHPPAAAASKPAAGSPPTTPGDPGHPLLRELLTLIKKASGEEVESWRELTCEEFHNQMQAQRTQVTGLQTQTAHLQTQVQQLQEQTVGLGQTLEGRLTEQFRHMQEPLGQRLDGFFADLTLAKEQAKKKAHDLQAGFQQKFQEQQAVVDLVQETVQTLGQQQETHVRELAALQDQIAETVQGRAALEQTLGQLRQDLGAALDQLRIVRRDMAQAAAQQPAWMLLASRVWQGLRSLVPQRFQPRRDGSQ